MKKIISKVIILTILLLLSVIVLIGCNDIGDSKVTGKYTLAAFIVEEKDVMDAITQMGIKDKMYIEFFEDGTYEMDIGFGGEEGVSNGTYVVDGKTVSLTDDKKTVTAELEGKRLTLIDSYYKATFEKK